MWHKWLWTLILEAYRNWYWSIWNSEKLQESLFVSWSLLDVAQMRWLILMSSCSNHAVLTALMLSMSHVYDYNFINGLIYHQTAQFSSPLVVVLCRSIPLPMKKSDMALWAPIRTRPYRFSRSRCWGESATRNFRLVLSRKHFASTGSPPCNAQDSYC